MTVKRKYLFLPLVIFFTFLSRLEAAELKVAATLAPISDLAQEIGGETIKVVTILPAGANPHTFELTPQLVRELDGVSAILRIGKNFDDWIIGISENLPRTKIVTLNADISLIDDDPHYWLSISNAKIMAKHIADVLIQLDPVHESEYRSRLARYLQKLTETDQQIKSKLESLKGRKIITFHDGWRYFARDYGLKVVGTIESSEGNEPTPKHLVELHQKVKTEHIQVLFTEPTVSKSVADSVAHDLNLKVVRLDPLGVDHEDENFIELMRRNADKIAEALT